MSQLQPVIWAVLVVVACLTLWFFAASIFTFFLSRSICRWLLVGLEWLGEISGPVWIGFPEGIVGARLIILQAQKPLDKAEIVFRLENRPNLPLWIIQRIQGRQDGMIVRADIRASSETELDIVYRLPRHRKSIEPPSGSTAQDSGWNPNYEVKLAGRPDNPLLISLKPFLAKYAGVIRSFSLHSTQPNLVMRVSLPLLRPLGARQFFEDLRRAFQPDQDVYQQALQNGLNPK